MSDNPIKLWPGPVEDGRETYFAKGKDIPKGWERRVGMVEERWKPWASLRSHGGAVAVGWYQVRPPARLPDPPTLMPEGISNTLVVNWGDMKDRPDLDQWERLYGNTTTGVRWHGLGPREGWPDNYPIRVRRKDHS